MAGASNTLRVLYIAAGCVFVAIGAVGTVLPLLPATPFILLALWCFTRSSQRLEHWILTHPLFGPTIHRWKNHRVVPLSVKLTAYGSMAISLSLMIYSARVPMIAIVSTAVIMVIGVIYIWRCPTEAPPEAIAEALAEAVEVGPSTTLSGVG